MFQNTNKYFFFTITTSTVAFKSLNSWWLNQIDFFQLFNQSKFNSNWRIINKYLVDFYTWKKSILDFSMKAYFTTLDNQLWLHFNMKSKDNKHMLLKPIYVCLRIYWICWKIGEIMLEKCHKCNIVYQKKCCG